MDGFCPDMESEWGYVGGVLWDFAATTTSGFVF